LARRSSEFAVASDACRAPQGSLVKVTFKITAQLLASVRADLKRSHPFAYERVGFIVAGLASCAGGVLILAREYRPINDDDYLRDPTVGAMMGPDAIRKAQEWALFQGHAIFHVHTHGGFDMPGFSGIDLRENAKFVPDFLKVAPQNIHGAIVLSHDAAAGQFWQSRESRSETIDEFLEVGVPLRKWGSHGSF
jgi:hypothetical protein